MLAAMTGIARATDGAEASTRAVEEARALTGLAASPKDAVKA